MASSLYQFFFKSLGYPLFLKLLGRPTYAYLNERIKTQYKSKEEIKSMQLLKLKKALINAQENVPFYRETFKRIGFNAKDMVSIAEFESLEFQVDKETVRANPDAFISEKCDKGSLSWHYTGGSTGQPLYFATDHKTDAASSAGLIRALKWNGVDIGARHCLFWGSPTFISQGDSQIKEYYRKLKLDFKERLMNRRVFLNYNIGPSNFRQIYAEIESFRPQYIRGMPTSLYIFSQLMIKAGLRFKKAKPVFIHSACEQLYDWQKIAIEEAFGCPAFNTYGLSEFGDIAFEAPCGGLHTMDEDIYIETKMFSKESCEIIATQLNNFSSPLIKYKTGDIVSGYGDCSNSTCKLGIGVIHNLQGRAHDFILAPDGRFLHGQFFTHVLVSKQGIMKYQVIQKRKDFLQLKLIVDNSYKKKSEERISASIRDYMGRNVNVEFFYVEDIPLTKRGKHRWIVSELGDIHDYI